MKIKLGVLLIFVAFAGIIFCGLSFGDTDPGDRLDKLVAAIDNKIKIWHLYFWISIISTISVGVLGLLITLFQSIDQVKYKTYTICLGTIISACTFLSHTFLKGDYRQYERIEQAGLIKQEELSNLVENYKKADDENKKIFWSNIKALIYQINSLEDSLTASKTDTTTSLASIQIIDSAYAGTAPGWITALPEDDNYLYFIGFADSASLANLNTAAQQNATQSAVSYMTEQFGQAAKKIDPEKLAKFLADSAEPYSSYISSDSGNKVYRYYSLMRISKNAIKTGVELFGVENNVAIPAALIAKIDDAKRIRDDYTARQTKLYETLEDNTKSKLNSPLYLKYLKARQLRKDVKNYPEAILLLKEIVQQQPDFYLGWYNLALAYDASNASSEAQSAYDQAIKLESALPVRDATLYNSYGHFFYKQKKYQDALTQYKKSLSLDPTNPRTQNNLNQVNAQIKSGGH
jgi:tetratricopeptide (TPR) repeat protein